MKERNSSNTDYDLLYPVTKAANVQTSSGENVETEITSLKQSVSNGKTQLEAAITDMGGTVSNTSGNAYPTFDNLDNGIRALTSGIFDSYTTAVRTSQVVDLAQTYGLAVFNNGRYAVSGMLSTQQRVLRVYDKTGTKLHEILDVSIHARTFVHDPLHDLIIFVNEAHTTIYAYNSSLQLVWSRSTERTADAIVVAINVKRGGGEVGYILYTSSASNADRKTVFLNTLNGTRTGTWMIHDSNPAHFSSYIDFNDTHVIINQNYYVMQLFTKDGVFIRRRNMESTPSIGGLALLGDRVFVHQRYPSNNTVVVQMLDLNFITLANVNAGNSAGLNAQSGNWNAMVKVGNSVVSYAYLPQVFSPTGQLGSTVTAENLSRNTVAYNKKGFIFTRSNYVVDINELVTTRM